MRPWIALAGLLVLAGSRAFLSDPPTQGDCPGTVNAPRRVASCSCPDFADGVCGAFGESGGTLMCMQLVVKCLETHFVIASQYTHALTTLLHDIIIVGEYASGGGNCSRCADECFADNMDGFCTGESGQARLDNYCYSSF